MSQESSYKWKYKREKRRTTKPYERPKNESLLTTVTSTVKDVIPTWIKNMASFLVPSTSAENPVEESNSAARDGVGEEEEVNSVEVGNVDHSLRPFKNFEPHSTKESKSALNDSVTIESMPSTFAASKLRETTADEEGSSTTSNTASSTSGCSSLVPSHQDHMLQRLDLPLGKSSLESLRKELMKKTRDIGVVTESKQMDDSVVTNKQSFLWSSGNLKRKAEFNVSKFFSPTSVIPNEKKSPFYEGRTSFGGASSKRARLTASSPYLIGTQRIPSIMRVKVTESKNLESTLSSTAKRILASMEKFSSPLEDAKKMPVYKEPLPNNMIIKPLKKFAKPMSSTFSIFEPKSMNIEEPKSQANLSSNLTSFDANQSDKEQGAPGGGKIRTKISKFSGNKVSKNNMENETVTLPILDLDDNLNNEKLSAFTFHPPLLPNKPQKKLDNVSQSPVKFSKPIDAQVLAEEKDKTENIQTDSHSLKMLSKSKDICLNDTTNGNETVRFGEKLVNSNGNSSNWSCPRCMIQNPIEKLKCAACDAFKPGAEIFSTEKVDSTDSWKCMFCLIDNDGSKCIRCGKFNSKVNKQHQINEDVHKNNLTSVKNDITLTNSGWGKKFAPPSDTWECDTCLVRNKSSDSKCVACETPKSSPKSNSEINQVYSGYKFSSVDTNSNIPVFKFGIPAEEKSLQSETENKTATSSPKKVSFNLQSEGGFGGFSKTSPTFSLTTSSSGSAPASTTTTNSSFTFGSLSSPKSDEKTTGPQSSINLTPAPDTVKTPSTTESLVFEPKDLKDTTPKTSVSDTLLKTGDLNKINKPEIPVSNSVFTFGSTSIKSDDSTKKADEEKPKENIVTSSTGTSKSETSIGATFTNTSTNAATTTPSLFATTTASQPAFKFPFGSSSLANTPLNSSNNASIETTKAPTSVTSTISPFTFGSGVVKTTSSESATAFATEPASQTASTKSGAFQFTFGTKSSLNNPTFPSTNVATLPTATPNTAVATTSTSGFSFGSSLAASKGMNSNFTFGSTSQPLVTTSATSAFNFNDKPATSSAFSFASSAKPSLQPSNAFSFGQSQSQPSTFAPPQPQPTTTAGASPFIFGSQPVTTSMNTMPPPAFNFNNTNSTLGNDFKSNSFAQNSLATSKFQFGQANQPPQPGLSFGASSSQPPLIPQPVMPSMNFSTTPNFNFGGQNSSSQPGAVFQFAATTTDGSISSVSATRNIKKAKRRLGNPL
ncbi:nuclear pore complex protein Nup153-like protein [Dinothrombium tinctorium]|uniref:Nuclear pore complex protein Nup153 n=1 Tax=Dinothrombium tinctorium TaxID=1965070 RepID=A0A3S3PGW3_9ACAR|nr:nuclear pore complex protein Nup153-like protein [Dinothrombium tinctorium]